MPMCWTIILKSGIPWALEGGGSICIYIYVYIYILIYTLYIYIYIWVVVKIMVPFGYPK